MRTCKYLSLGDFGMCFFTYLLLAKSRPNRPKTNQKCQRYATFVILNMQVRIFEKKDEKQRKPDKKRARDWKVSKAGAGEVKKSKLSSNLSKSTLQESEKSRMALGIKIQKLQH